MSDVRKCHEDTLAREVETMGEKTMGVLSVLVVLDELIATHSHELFTVEVSA